MTSPRSFFLHHILPLYLNFGDALMSYAEIGLPQLLISSVTYETKRKKMETKAACAGIRSDDNKAPRVRINQPNEGGAYVRLHPTATTTRKRAEGLRPISHACLWVGEDRLYMMRPRYGS